MLSQLRPAVTMALALTALLGIAYPLAVTGAAQALMPAQANGSLIERDGRIVGSALIGQSFTGAGYLHPRPSAAGEGYDAMASGGSNLGPSSAKLVADARARAAAWGAAPAPAEMITASASGLDPHISLDAALAQAPRIAAARGMDPAAVETAIRGAARGPAFGFVGAPVVNVLAANLALDAGA